MNLQFDRVPTAKKFVKPDPVKNAIYSAPPVLKGSIFFYGKIGSGKTTALMSFCQRYHDHPGRKYKIFDLWGGDRNEQYYWTLPARNINYAEFMKKRLKLDGDLPKQYQVNLLFPFTKNLPKDLPHNPPYVFSKVFTIPLLSVEPSDIACVKGVLTDTDEYAWREIKDRSNKKTSGAEVLDMCEELKITNTSSMYRNFIYPLVKDGLLQSAECPYNLDIKAEFKDRETISVLCLDYIDPEFRLFIMDYILRTMQQLLDSGKLSPRNIVIIREASTFFKSDMSDIVPPRIKVFKDHMKHYLRMGRRGIHPFLETQSPAETKGFLDGSEDFKIIGKLPSEEDREFVTYEAKKDGFITNEQIREMSSLEPGQYFLMSPGKRSRKISLLLPRTDYWREGAGSFIEMVWKRRVGKYTNIKEDIDKILGYFEEANNQIQQKKKEQKIIEAMQEKQKEQDEEDKLRRREERKMQIQEEIKAKKKQIREVEKIVGKPLKKNALDNISSPNVEEPKQNVNKDDLDYDLEGIEY